MDLLDKWLIQKYDETDWSSYNFHSANLIELLRILYYLIERNADHSIIKKCSKEVFRLLRFPVYRPGKEIIIPNNPCVYICLDENDNVIYVGRAKDIRSRESNHHINTWWWDRMVNKLMVAEVPTLTDMALYEIYYINKYKPPMNFADKFDDHCTFTLPDLQFKLYKTY